MEAPAPSRLPQCSECRSAAFPRDEGGDLNKALTDALDYNNRLGKNGQPAAEQTIATPPVPTVEPAPPAPVATPEVIEANVQRLLISDQEAVANLQNWQTSQAELNEIAGRIPPQGSRQHRGIRLKIPEYQDDPVQQDAIKAELRSLKADLSLTRVDEYRKQIETDKLRDQYNGRAKSYETRIQSTWEARAEGERQKAESDAAITATRRSFRPLARGPQGCGDRHNIPDDMHGDLDELARLTADAT